MTGAPDTLWSVVAQARELSMACNTGAETVTLPRASVKLVVDAFIRLAQDQSVGRMRDSGNPYEGAHAATALVRDSLKGPGVSFRYPRSDE